MRGTATSTETRSRRIVAMISVGLKVFSNTTVAPSSGGRKIPRNCPKTWLSGSRLRKRIGCTSRSYFRYFPISVSIGARLPTTLAWVSTTPLGSAVVPEVKTISSGSEG